MEYADQFAAPSTVDEAVQLAGRQSGSPYRHGMIDLHPIDHSLPIEIGELAVGRVWPPVRMHDRATRDEDLARAWHGDWSHILDVRELTDVGVTPSNMIRRILAVQASLIMRERPTGPGEKIGHAAHKALIQLSLHGAAFVEYSQGMWRCVDSRRVWWTSDGSWILVEPRTLGTDASSSVPLADSIQVTVIRDGHGARWWQTITPSNVGEYPERWQITGPPTGTVTLGPSAIGAAYRPPEIEQGGWGTSGAIDLLGVVAQLGRARARDTKVIEAHASPLLVLRGSLVEFQGVGQHQSLYAREAGLGRTPEAILNDQRTMARIKTHGYLQLQDGSQYAEYITWDNEMSASMGLQARLDAELRMHSGITMMMGSDAAIPSGMSLKRMYYIADAEAAILRASVLRALQDCADGIAWADAFESLDTQNREDVEDEARADRGQMTSGDDEEPES